MGLALTIFWSLPSRYLQDKFGVPELSSGPEMLFISGILLVSGAVLVIMYNTDLLLRLILLILGRSPRFAPVLRMAIAYPLSNRFRTGMTIAIFAVVMFSVIFMATLFKVNDIVLTDTEQFTGGFDLRVDYSSNNPVDDLPRAIARQPGLRRADYAVIASLINLPVELKQGQSGRWAGYLIQAADDAYLENVDYGIGVMAEGYTTAAEIWEAVRDKPGFAVVDRLAVPSRTTTNIVIGGPEFSLAGRLPRGRDDGADPVGGARAEQRSDLRSDRYWRPRAVGDHGLWPDHLAGDAGEGSEHRAAGANVLHPAGRGRRSSLDQRGAGERVPEERPGKRRSDPGAA